MYKRFLIIIGIFLCLSNYAQTKSIPKSLDFESITDTIQFKQAFIQLQNIKGINKTEESLESIKKLIKVGKKLDYDSGLAKLYWYEGRILLKNNKTDLSTKSYELAEKYFKKTNNLKWLATVCNDRYVLESNKGNLEKSADYLLESKMYSEKLADSAELAIVYSNLGAVNANLKKYESSEIFFKKAITIRKKIGLLKKMGIVLNNMAYMYSLNNKYKEAKEILKESLILNKRDSLTNSVAYTYAIMAEIALFEKDYELAEKYFDTTIHIASVVGYESLINTGKQQLGYLAILSKQYQKADKLLKYTRKEFAESKSKQLLLKNYEYSSKLDSTKGNFIKALTWQLKYQKLSEEITSDLSTEKIERAEARYQAELTQLRTIDAQVLTERRIKEELFRYRIFTFIALVVLSVSLALVLWIIRTRKERKKLITQLNDSNQVKNKLFSIISHDLKNEIHGLEGSLNLMQDNELSTEEFDEIVPLLADRTNQTAILLNNLLNWSKSQLKELSAKPVSFDVSELISSKFTFFNPKARQKKIKLINKLGSTNVYADKDMIGIVAQNLIANAIKFCKSGNSITLESKEKDEHYEIGFADTGIGIDPANINKLFAEETFTTNGTQNESGTGLGLRICKELIALNKGTIRVESKLGEGTTFFVVLPKPSS